MVDRDPLMMFVLRRSQLQRLIAEQVEGQVECLVSQFVRRYVTATIAGLEGRIRTLTDEMTILGERMTSVEQAEQERWTRLGELAALIKAEFASLKGQVERAVADKDAAVAAGVASALGEEAQADVDRLDGLIGEFESVLPEQAPVPEVPVPGPGEPAELPTEPPVEETPGEG